MKQAVLLLLWLYLLVPASGAQDLSLPGASRAQPVLQAQPATGEITIDGMLDEPGWASAPAAANFVQFEPDEGAAPSQRTEVRVLYGERGLYIGALLYDDEPERIQDRLTRRDNRNQADWFDVSIDSQLDQQTAYTFAVNAAGVQRDGLTQNRTDTAWDAIWDSAVQITNLGWGVEMHIPYSMLRFSRGTAQRWGLQLERRIPRTGERLEWAFTPRTERGGKPVAEYGRLVNLNEVRPRRNIQVFPYLLTQVDTREGEQPGKRQADERFDAGTDIQIGFGPNVTLNATINPDFGQIQSDPATLNLTAFETFFPERRPFFTEGSQFFSFDQQGGALLNTRRIGAAAPIIGATKVTGRTPSGLSFGGMTAVEGDAFSPQRYYGAGALQQDIGTYSKVGGMLTAFEGPRHGTDRRSLSGGVNWDFRLASNTYQIRGHASFTHRDPSGAPNTGPATGFSASTRLARVQGATTYDIRGTLLDDHFNPNDLGRLRQNNFFRARARIEHEFNDGQSFGAFQRANAFLSFGQSWTYDEQLDRGIGHFARTTWTFRNFSRIRLWTSSDYLAGGYDVFETRGEGPRARPREFDVGLNVRSDSRRSWQVSPRVSTTVRQDDGLGYGAGLGSSWDANQYLSFSASTSYERGDNFIEWASNETVIRQDDAWLLAGDGGRKLNSPMSALDELFDSRRTAPDQAVLPVYGARDTRTLDVELSADVTLSPALSIELFGQLFAARGQYRNFQILQTRDKLASFEAYPRRHDFAISSFIANTVLRWEYQPGSELFVVWSQARRQRLDEPFFFDEPGGSPFEPSTVDRIGDIFGNFPSNTFSVKLSYALTS